MHATVVSLLLLVFTLGSLTSASNDWVLHVPGGLEHAKEVAEAHDLENLGEVIPESNLYHFQQSSRRARRSAEDLTEKFAANALISSFHAQDKSLTRVKRVPVPQDDLRSTGSQLCFVNTVETEKKASKRCIFPFGYKGKTYLECTSDHSSNGAEWCATQVDASGDAVSGQWGDCDKKSLSCVTLGAGSVGIEKDPVKVNDEPGNNPQPPTGFPEAFGPPQGFGGQGAPRFPPNFVQGPPRFSQPPQGRFPQQPPNGFPPNQLPARSFSGPPSNNQFGPPPPRSQSPSGKSALPPQFQFDPSFLFGLTGGLGNQKPPSTEEEVWPDVDRSQFKTNLNDEAWPAMWYLNRGGKGLDMNVEEAWAQGVTGKGVVVTILDDGVEWNHPDLKENYDKEASIDFNDNDDDPFPRYDFFNSNKHGTRCAGTVAAAANNSACAVGIAYNAKIGGVRILDGNIIDVLEAKAISFKRDHIDIYSASWGPDDDGKTVDGPGPLAKLALEDGVRKGRNGKGSIFVWASGNGGKYLDNCNCDGYTTSIYTLSVSSVSETGKTPWYSESCSSSLATTYSSGTTKGARPEKKVVTTDLHGKCTSQHTGTSASSPMAAGIVALVLEANPDLTWRDLQHIVVRTAIPQGHLQSVDWKQNGAGLTFSHAYGFGLMDAGAMVKLAKQWKNVPESAKCTTEPGQSGVNKNRPILIKPNSEEASKLNVSNCGNIKFLEHIHLLIDLTSGSERGALTVLLVSPSGTMSVLLAPRPFDKVRTGLGAFQEWPMMSVHFWGESSVTDEGSEWTLIINNAGDKPAILNDWQLVFYGTEEDPQPELASTSSPDAQKDGGDIEARAMMEDPVDETTVFAEDLQNLTDPRINSDIPSEETTLEADIQSIEIES